MTISDSSASIDTVHRIPPGIEIGPETESALREAAKPFLVRRLDESIDWEDVYQNALLYFLESDNGLDAWDRQRSIVAFFMGFLKNAYLRNSDKQRRDRLVTDSTEVLLKQSSSVADEEFLFSDADLHLLDDEEAELWRLHCYGMSYRDIARRVGRGNDGNRVSLALRNRIRYKVAAAWALTRDFRDRVPLTVQWAGRLRVEPDGMRLAEILLDTLIDGMEQRAKTSAPLPYDADLLLRALFLRCQIYLDRKQLGRNHLDRRIKLMRKCVPQLNAGCNRIHWESEITHTLGRRHQNQHDFCPAVEKYRQSQDVSESGTLMRDIGSALRAEGSFEEARRYLSMAGQWWLDPKQDNPLQAARCESLAARVDVDEGYAHGDSSLVERGRERLLSLESPELMNRDKRPLVYCQHRLNYLAALAADPTSSDRAFEEARALNETIVSGRYHRQFFELQKTCESFVELHPLIETLDAPKKSRNRY